ELLQHVLRHPERVRVVTDVGLRKDRVASDLADLLGDLLRGRLTRDVVDRDVGAFLGKRQCDGAPDTTRSSGHERGAPLELHESHLLSAWAASLARRGERGVMTRGVMPVIVTFKPPRRGSAMAYVIKRYSNRKLYDTQESRYVTLEEIEEMIRA